MSEPYAERFPSFDAMSQQRHWDAKTRQVILDRVRGPSARRFFTAREFDTAAALLACLVDVEEATGRHLAATVDGRMAADRTDGWRFDDMPRDEESWRRSLAALDEDAAGDFAAQSSERRIRIIAAMRRVDGEWHGLPAGRLFDLWLRYACTAYYAQPAAWNEIGFAGPAYPRGYKNLGVDALEPFEVRDARPDDDPVRRQST